MNTRLGDFLLIFYIDVSSSLFSLGSSSLGSPSVALVTNNSYRRDICSNTRRDKSFWKWPMITSCDLFLFTSTFVLRFHSYSIYLSFVGKNPILRKHDNYLNLNSSSFFKWSSLWSLRNGSSVWSIEPINRTTSRKSKSSRISLSSKWLVLLLTSLFLYFLFSFYCCS